MLSDPLYDRELTREPELMRAQKDFPDEIDGVVAHEIGHAPPTADGQKAHNEGGLMRDGAGPASQFDFLPRTIARFRATKSWSAK